MKINRTIQRSFEMLSYIAQPPAGVSIEELCQQFSIPKTSAYDILVTLVQNGMLTLCPGNRQLYQIGSSAYRIGMSYPESDDELKLIGSALKEIANLSGKTAFFGQLYEYKVLYILKETPPNPIITTATIGSTAPLYCTSLGKTLLTYMPKDQADHFLESLNPVPRTGHTLTTREAVAADLALTASRGYAMDFREYEEHMVCVGAPVFRKDSTLVGAISISGFYRPEENYESSGQFISQKASELSHLLGYHNI